MTVRPIGKGGRWEAKTQKEYICKRGEEEGKFTAPEFKAAQMHGWQKEYHYNIDGTRIWLTPSDAEKRGLSIQDRVNRSPRSTLHGRQNPTTAFWNDTKRITEWRQSWAEICNKKLEEAHVDARIDARSYKDQGIDRISSVHLGTYGNALEKRARRLEREGVTHSEADKGRLEMGRLNQEIKNYNKTAEKFHQTEKAAEKKVQQTAHSLENLRARSLYSGYAVSSLSKTLATLQKLSKEKEADVQDSLSLLEAMAELNNKSAEIIAALTSELEQLPIWKRGKKQSLKSQIEEEQKKIDDRNKFVVSEWQRHGFQNESGLQSESEQQKERTQTINKQSNQIRLLEREAKMAATEYETLAQSIPVVYQEKLDEELLQIKPQTENEILRRLQQEFKDDFSHTDYAKYRQADRKAGSNNRSRDIENRETLFMKKHSRWKRKSR